MSVLGAGLHSESVIAWVRACLRHRSILLLLFLTLFADPVQAQPSEEDAVRVVSAEAILLEQQQGFSLMVGGEVVNTLKEVVQSVVVALWIPEFDQEARFTIEQLAPGQSEKVLLSVDLAEEPERYVLAVVAYDLTTTDIERLFGYFWESDRDALLRKAAASRLGRLPPSTLGARLNRFQERPTSPAAVGAYSELVEDILLLPGLAQGDDERVAIALLDTAETYAHPSYLTAYRALLDMATESETILPLLNTAVDQNLALDELLRQTLVELGDAVLPTLIAAGYGAPGLKAELALATLDEMGRATARDQLAVSDPAVRLSVIQVLSQSRDLGLADVFLDVEADDDATQQALVDALLVLGPDALPLLDAALDAPGTSRRVLALHALQRQPPDALPTLVAALQARDPARPSPGSVIEAANALAEAAGDARQERLESIVNRASSQVTAGECAAALAALDELAELDRDFHQAEAVRARAHSCLGDLTQACTAWRSYLAHYPGNLEARAEFEALLLAGAETAAAAGDLDQALELATEAQELNPSESTADLLSDLHLDAARECQDEGDSDCALTHYAEAGDRPETRAAVGAVLLNHNLPFALVGIVLVILTPVIMWFGYSRLVPEPPETREWL